MATTTFDISYDRSALAAVGIVVSGTRGRTADAGRPPVASPVALRRA